MLKQLALLILCALFGVLGSKAINEYKRASTARLEAQQDTIPPLKKQYQP